MAGSPKLWYCYDQPLDGEVAHFANDIIFEGSDAEDSPSTKTERQRRREAIGQRYLQGHTPYIQSASLHGPFGPGSGWKNPWKRRQKAELAEALEQPFRATHESKKILASLGERKSDTLRNELQILVNAGGRTSSKPPHGYIKLRNDNEDDISENKPRVSYAEDHDGAQDCFAAESKRSSSRNMSPTGGTVGNISNASKEGLGRLDQRSGKKGTRIIGTASEQARNKRKANTSWLKGTHMLKRSRYEILDHSSPTPAAGSCHTTIAQVLPPSFLPASFITPQKYLRTSIAVNGDQAYKEGWSSSTKVTMTPSAAENLSDMDELAAHNSESIDSSGLKHMAQPLENGSGLTFVRNETAVDNLGLEDVQDLHKASHLSLSGGSSPVATPDIHKRRLEIEELSPSDPDCGETTTVTELRQRSHQKLGPAKSTAKARDLNRHEVNAKDSKTSPGSDTSASAGSFQYRRRNQTLKRKKVSPFPQQAAEKHIDVEEFSDQKEKQGLEPAKHSTTSIDYNQDSKQWSKFRNSNSKRTPEISSKSHIAQLDKRYKLGVSHASDLNSETEAVGVSSPDSSSEGLIKLDKFQPSIHGNSSSRVVSIAEKLSMGRSTSEAHLNQVRGLEDQQQHKAVVCFDGESQHYIVSRSFVSPSGSFGQSDITPQRQKCAIYVEHDQSPAMSSDLKELSHGKTQEVKAARLLQEIDNIRQSPWMDAGLEGLQRVFSRGSISDGSSNEESHNDAENRTHNAHADDIIPKELHNDVQKELPAMEFINTPENKLSNSHQELPNIAPESVELFPSTQVLIDAATVNPWNSCIKKSKSRKSMKRVSFEPLPLDDIDNSIPQLPLNVTERFKSPPLEEGTLLLTQLDDGFHYKLRAAQPDNAEKSPTAIMNSQWQKTSALKSRAKPFPNSPAVGAMAEAFIAADWENMPRNSSPGDKAKPIRTDVNKIKPLVTSESWNGAEPQQHQAQSRSPLDASFSITPSGKVTAVNYNMGIMDAEDNLDAMIDDVGSFFEGWDIDLELQKAKGTKLEKGHDLLSSSRREYLSGLSNR